MKARTYELTPVGRKSFYSKCQVNVSDNDIHTLQSYSTNVAEFNANTGEMNIYGTYSNTTTRHIRAFLKSCGFWSQSGYPKSRLDKMVGKPFKTNDN